MPDPTPHQRLYSRRSMLRTAGLGAATVGAASLGAAGFAAAATAAPAVSDAPRVAPAPTADLPLVGGETFPIGIFWPPPPLQTTVERYAEIADAGFTFLITGNYLFDEHISRYALHIADQVGLKVLIAGDPRMDIATGDNRVFRIEDGSAAPLTLDLAEARALMAPALTDPRYGYVGHPSYAGINLYDEPGAGHFPSLAKNYDIMRELAPTLLPYSNMFPSVDRNYITGYAETLNPSVLSFDRYPLLADGSDDPHYFLNWAIVREVALARNIPSWIYIQTLAYHNHRTPNAAELAWQVNVSLAYGCKGIQYFTYWTPDPARGEGFQPALLTVDGQRTERYDHSKRLNTAWLQPVGRQLKPLVSESVVHANETPLPAGAVGFTPDAYLREVTGDAVVVGRFRGADPARSERWLFVANRSHRGPATSRVKVVPETVAAVARFDPATGEYVRLPNPATIDVSLPAGGAALYRLTTR